MKMMYRSIAEVIVAVLGLTVAAGGADAQSRACLEGRGGIMTDLGFELDPRPEIAAPRFSSEPRVTRVREDGPATGRLEEGDLLVAVDGQPVTSAAAGRRYAAVRPGDRIELSIRRDDRRLDVTVVAIGRCIPHPPPPPDAPSPPPPPPAPDAPAPPLPPADELMPDGWLGFTLRCEDCADDPETGVLRFNAPPIVASVDPGSPAGAAGIRTGDRLTHMNGQPLTTPSGWARFHAIQPGETVRFRFTRGGGAYDVTVRAVEPK